MSCYPDVIPGIASGATWAADSATLYYMTVDDAWRPDTVWRHRLGAGLPAEKVYHEPDERFWLGVGRTRSDKYVMIAAGSSITSEMFYADAADPKAEFTSILPRREGVEYSVEHAVVGGEDRFLILHNDGAVNFALVEAPVADPTDQRTLSPDATTCDSMRSTRSRVIWWSATGARRFLEFSCGPSPRTVSTAQPRTSSSTRS